MSPQELQKIVMGVVPSDICSDIFDFQMNHFQFCAYTREGVGACVVKISLYYITSTLYLFILLQILFDNIFQHV
jgi:hypothetical protein